MFFGSETAPLSRCRSCGEKLPLQRVGEGAQRVLRGRVRIQGEGDGPLEDELRRRRHPGRMGAADEHDLLAQVPALAAARQVRVLVQDLLEGRLARLGVDVGHEAARVVLGPVVAEDEARLDAVRLELVENNGIRRGAVHTHPRAD